MPYWTYRDGDSGLPVESQARFLVKSPCMCRRAIGFSKTYP